MARVQVGDVTSLGDTVAADVVQGGQRRFHQGRGRAELHHTVDNSAHAPGFDDAGDVIRGLDGQVRQAVERRIEHLRVAHVRVATGIGQHHDTDLEDGGRRQMALNGPDQQQRDFVFDHSRDRVLGGREVRYGFQCQQTHLFVLTRGIAR